MSEFISAELRRLVKERAKDACEYCRIREVDTFVGCQVDHIIAVKHGGPTAEENLAFACAACNWAKGSDIASIVPGTKRLVRLFNPRTDRWDDHFRIDPATFHFSSITEIGEVTIFLLSLNSLERVLEREALAEIGHYIIPRRAPR